MPTLLACRRHDMSDAAWLVLEPVLAAVLPPAKGPGRPRKWPLRLLVDAIRWRVRAGVPWRDVPDCYGPWQPPTAYSASGSATAPGPPS